MALLPTGWIKMPGDNDETKRFAWSHVKSIFYNKAANILLKDKLDEMDKIIDEKIAKALMSNVQVNDQGKIPTSALAYAMQQSITKNGQDIAKLNSDLTISDAKMAVERNSKGVYLMLRNKITNNRLSLLLDEGTKKLVLDSEISGEWTGADPIVTKSDLGVAQYNAINHISLSGKLSNIGEWIKNNGTPNKCTCVRVEPSDSDGYFGTSSFSILWMRTSVNYGWCILISDNPKMVVFGRNSVGWHWYAPSLTEVS